MRIIVFLLLAVNVLFFIIFGGWFSTPPKDDEVVDERIKIIAQKDLPQNSTLNDERFANLNAALASSDSNEPMPAEEDQIAAFAQQMAATENAAQTSPEPKTETTPPAEQQTVAENKPEKIAEEQPADILQNVVDSLLTTSCVVWANLSNEDSLQVQKLLVKRFPNIPATVTSKSESSGKWRIFIPPLASVEAARARARTLKELSLDYFVLASGENKNAISLGVFSKEKSARAYFAELQEKGVTDAILQFRASTNISTGAITDVRIDVKDAKERARVVDAVRRVVPHKDAKSCS